MLPSPRVPLFWFHSSFGGPLTADSGESCLTPIHSDPNLTFFSVPLMTLPCTGSVSAGFDFDVAIYACWSSWFVPTMDPFAAASGACGLADPIGVGCTSLLCCGGHAALCFDISRPALSASSSWRALIRLPRCSNFLICASTIPSST